MQNNYVVEINQRCTPTDILWRQKAKENITRTVVRYGKARKNCAGIDLRLSQPFVTREVMHSHICVQVFKHNSEHSIGFAYVKKMNSNKSLYVTLLVSFEPGIGTYLLSYLRDSPDFKQQVIVLRSTDEALLFYMKQGFVLADWVSIYEGVMPYATDRNLTQKLEDCVRSKQPLESVRQTLVFRNWCEHDTKEWPLLLWRCAIEVNNDNGKRRTSTRLRDKHLLLTNRSISSLV